MVTSALSNVRVHIPILTDGGAADNGFRFHIDQCRHHGKLVHNCLDAIHDTLLKRNSRKRNGNLEQHEET